MADPSPLEYLQKIRAVMVEQRRYICMDRVEMWNTNNTEPTQASPFVDIIQLQNVIAAIDSAIADEKKMIPPKHHMG